MGQRPRPVGELAAQRVGDGAVGDDPLGGHADLALVKERPEARGGGGAVKVGVSEHDHRRFAAELEQHSLEVAPGLLGDDPPNPG
jgi:hypothetical protein